VIASPDSKLDGQQSMIPHVVLIEVLSMSLTEVHIAKVC
jgi:hypothetical protein